MFICYKYIIINLVNPRTIAFLPLYIISKPISIFIKTLLLLLSISSILSFLKEKRERKSNNIIVYRSF